jgi:hypothetical protein
VFGLPKDYPETFRAKMAVASPEQIRTASAVLLGSENSVIAVTGDWPKVKDQLTEYKDIKFFNTDGKPIAPPQ